MFGEHHHHNNNNNHHHHPHRRRPHHRHHHPHHHHRHHQHHQLRKFLWNRQYDGMTFQGLNIFEHCLCMNSNASLDMLIVFFNEPMTEEHEAAWVAKACWLCDETGHAACRLSLGDGPLICCPSIMGKRMEKDDKAWDFGVPDFETDPLSSPVSFCPMNHRDIFPRMWRQQGRASQQALLYSYFKAGNPAKTPADWSDGPFTAVSHAFVAGRRRFRPLLVLIIRQCLQALDLDSKQIF